jgi:hypothetical protein
MPERLTPKHPRWGEFIFALDDALVMQEDPQTGEPRWTCPHDPSYPLAAGILAGMADIDVAATLRYFRRHAGCVCDCAVRLNTNFVY